MVAELDETGLRALLPSAQRLYSVAVVTQQGPKVTATPVSLTTEDPALLADADRCPSLCQSLLAQRADTWAFLDAAYRAMDADGDGRLTLRDFDLEAAMLGSSTSKDEEVPSPNVPPSPQQMMLERQHSSSSAISGWLRHTPRSNNTSNGTVPRTLSDSFTSSAHGRGGAAEEAEPALADFIVSPS